MNSVYDKVLEILWEAKKQGKLPYKGPERRLSPERRSIRRKGGEGRRIAALIAKDTAQAREVAQERDPPISPAEEKHLTAKVQKYFPWRKKR